LKILIPSKERADAIGSCVLKFTGIRDDIKVYVKQHEMENYYKVLPKRNIFEIPNDLVGVGAVRKYLVDQHRSEDYIGRWI